jgi:hypothetical protein
MNFWQPDVPPPVVLTVSLSEVRRIKSVHFWRGFTIAAIVFGAVGFWACAALTMWEGM